MSASVSDTPSSNSPPDRQPTARGRLLVVEDEWLISSLLSEYLVELGFEVVGPARSIVEAVELARSAAIDAALVDLSLDGVLANEVLDVLTTRRIPFIFVTGYSTVPDGIRARALLLEKPFTTEELIAAIESVLGQN